MPNPLFSRLKAACRANYILLFILTLMLLRLLSLGSSPIFDPSEGRYSEIAREMLQTGDWVTPRLSPTLSFLGKPPLHFWMTAVSLKLFGLNAFAARIPSFLSMLFVIALTGFLASRFYGRRAALWAAMILISSGLVFIGSAYVVTDMTLTACVTGTMASFLLAMNPASERERRLAGYAFFVFLGLGMLAKGPIAVALCVIAIGLWSLALRRIRWYRELPWIGGLALATLICAPWYIMAEIRNPGFLNYFFIHEHILRYLRRDYGDRYSSGHNSPYGTIWVLFFVGFLPWTPFYLWAAGHALRLKLWKRLSSHSVETLLVCWSLAPLLFFTVSRNVMVTYVLPGLPALAILGGRILSSIESGERRPTLSLHLKSATLSRILNVTCYLMLLGALGALGYGIKLGLFPLIEEIYGILIVALCLATLFFTQSRHAILPKVLCLAMIVPFFTTYFSVFLSDELGQARSARDLITVIHETPRLSGREIVFFSQIPYSAEFYLANRVSSMHKQEELLNKKFLGRQVLVMSLKDYKKIDVDRLAQMTRVSTFGPYVLLIPTQS